MREQAGRMERGEVKQGSGALLPLAGDGRTVSTGACQRVNLANSLNLANLTDVAKLAKLANPVN